MSKEDDPFSCFGSDSEEEEEEEHENPNDDQIPNHSSSKQKSAHDLLQQVNSRMNKGDVTSKHLFDNVKSATTSSNPPSQKFKVQNEPSIWKSHPPIYLGPIEIDSQNTSGGGRGYIANQDLNPGTLLLVEQPTFTWPEEQIGKPLGLVSIEALLEDPNAINTFKAMEDLHPTRTNVELLFRGTTDEKSFDNQILDMMNLMREEHDPENILKLVDLARVKDIVSTTNQIDEVDLEERTYEPITDKDIFRVLLALRYNGFGSGLYLHFAIFNHSCNPNCIKFTPTDEQGRSDNPSPRLYSEVRTTKFVKKGDPLTLHYLHPREQSHASRRLQLFDQHGFDIGEKPLEQFWGLELVGPLCKDPEALTRVENTINELEGLRQELSQLGAIMRSMDDENKDSQILCLERSKALELAVVELCQETARQLDNSQHILLIRCLRLHLETCELLLLLDEHNENLTPSQQSDIMCRFVKSSKELLNLQQHFLGDYHPDVVRTLNDLAQSIGNLLSSDPKKLGELDTGDGVFWSFSQWLKEENKCKKEHARIRDMYPHDIDSLINASKSEKS